MDSSFEIVKAWVRRVFDFLKEEKNLGAITWISTAFTAISVALLKFFSFVYESGKLAYWKVSPAVIDMATDNIVYDIIVTVVFAIVIFLLFLIPYFIAKSKMKKWVKVLLFVGIAVGFSVILFLGSNALEIIQKYFWMGLGVFVVADILFLAMLFLPSVAFHIMTKPPKNPAKPMTKKEAAIILVVLVVVNIVCFYGSAYYAAATETEYRITTDGYAIIYETDDVYYLAKFDAENKNILKGNQKIIEKTGVEYTWKNIKE